MSWTIKSHEAPKTGGAEPMDHFLNEKDMAEMVHVFVEKEQPDDYKCKSCNMRIITREGEDQADCTIVEGGISLNRGVCSYWSYGEEPATEDKKAKDRMNYVEAGYEETPSPEDKINCSTCYFYETVDDKSGNCWLWMGQVKAGNCCMAYKNEKNTVPKASQ